MTLKHGLHLVGSVAMKDTETVFRALSEKLAPWLKRMPDGETGERYHWVFFQRKMLLEHPAIEIDPDAPILYIKEWNGRIIRETQLLRFKPGVDTSKVTFETGYSKAAIDSYSVFKSLRNQGVIPQGIRFQVALPTPMSSGFMYVSPTSYDQYFEVYERSLVLALQDILKSVPANDLAIQWDICQEVLVFESYFPNRPADYRERVFSLMARLANAVPADVEVGFHMCYGSPKDAHLVMPKDMGIMVEILNGCMPRIQRKVDFIHMPVPQDRIDDAYFAPLTQLNLSPETELYLGLIHYDDPDGDRKRAQVASKYTSSFGIATECGWGRTEPERVPGLIEAHRRAIQMLS